MRGLSKADFADFVSPWAINIADEEFFAETMCCIAETIDFDSTVFTLFNLLVMVSPPQKTVPHIAGNHRLKEIQTETVLYMYRYLTSKAGKCNL